MLATRGYEIWIAFDVRVYCHNTDRPRRHSQFGKCVDGNTRRAQPAVNHHKIFASFDKRDETQKSTFLPTLVGVDSLHNKSVYSVMETFLDIRR